MKDAHPDIFISILHNPNCAIMHCLRESQLHKQSRAIMVVIVWLLDLQLPVQSVPITTKVVSSNLVHGEVYLIQHYVIKFVSDL